MCAVKDSITFVIRSGRWRGRPLAWWGTLLAMIGLAGVGLLYGAFLVFIDDLACPTQGADSNWGQLSWSFMPPGPRCTWTQEMNGINRIQGPGPVMSVWLLVLIGLTIVLVRWSRSARVSHEASTAL